MKRIKFILSLLLASISITLFYVLFSTPVMKVNAATNIDNNTYAQLPYVQYDEDIYGNSESSIYLNHNPGGTTLLWATLDSTFSKMNSSSSTISPFTTKKNYVNGNYSSSTSTYYYVNSKYIYIHWTGHNSITSAGMSCYYEDYYSNVKGTYKLNNDTVYRLHPGLNKFYFTNDTNYTTCGVNYIYSTPHPGLYLQSTSNGISQSESNQKTNFKADSVSLFYVGQSTTTTSGFTYSGWKEQKVYETEGVHTVSLDNTKSYTFTIDRTGPIATVDGINVNGKTFYQDIKIILSDNYQDYIFYDYSLYDSTGSRVDREMNNNAYSVYLFKTGRYELILKDKLRNTSTYTFYLVDNKQPTLNIYSSDNELLSDNSHTNKDITATITDNFLNAYIEYSYNNSSYIEYSDNTILTSEGTYIFRGVDATGLTSTKTITIDKTAPTGKFYDSNNNIFSNGTYTNKNIYFSSPEKDCTCTLNGAPYSQGTYITTEGQNTIIITDKANNSAEYTIYYSKTSSEGTLNGVSNGGYTKNNVSFIWNDHLITSCTLDGKNYSSGTIITSEGTHVIILTNKYGNKSTYTFTIDKTAPVGSLANVTNESVTNKNVSFSWSDTMASAILDGNAYAKGTEISSEGTHTIVLTDTASNSSTYTFTIDKTAPEGTLNGVENNGITNGNVSFTWTEGGCTCLLNNQTYSKGAIIHKEGVYTIYLMDGASNRSIAYSFEIDKTAPTGSLSNVNDGEITNKNVSFSWSDTKASAILDGSSYSKNAVISSEGLHTIVLTDTAGNSSTYTFTIDKTAPTFILYNSKGEEIITSDSYSGELISLNYSEGIYFYWPEETASATINGLVYENATNIIDEDQYSFIISDEVGNKCEVNFTLDYTPYTKNYNYFLENNYSYQNYWCETYSYNFDEASNSYKKDITYSFSSYQNAYNYALSREMSTIETGIFNGSTIWSNTYNCYIDNYETTNAVKDATYYIYKDASNKPYAYFSTDSRDEMIAYYIQNSIKEKWKPSVPANVEENDSLLLDAIYISGTSISFNYKPTDVRLYISNGSGSFEYASYNTVITTEVTYSILEIDAANNELSYILILDNSAPSFVATDLTGNSLPVIQNYINNQSEIRITSPIYLKSIDEFDNNCVLYVNDETYIYSSTSLGYKIDKTGEYKFYSVDAANNKTLVKTIIVSLEEISINIKDSYSSEDILLGFELIIEKNNKFNAITDISIKQTTSEGIMLLSKDNNNVNISPNTLSYFFNVSGLYTIDIVDHFGRVYSIEHEIQRDNPTGKLFTGDGIYLQNGYIIFDNENNIIKNSPAITNQSVYLSWNDATLKAYIVYTDKTETEYKALTKIYNAGSYIIRLESTEGKSTYFTFTIDKTAAKGNFMSDSDNSVINSSITNKDFYFTWDEDNCICKINNSPYDKGTVISLEGTYKIELYDRANNVSSYSITLKKTPTKVTISSGSINYSSGSFVNKNVTFSWNESGCTYYLDGVEYDDGNSITVRSEGTHILSIIDKAGNTASYSITIDKTAPVGILYTESDNKLENNYTNQSVYLSWTEDNIISYINGIIYEKNTLITMSGDYTITIYDQAGNSSSYSFSINKIAPVGTLNGVEDGGITNTNVKFNWNISGCTCTLDGKTYNSDTTISSEGTHTIVLSDKYGNSTIYSFEIKKSSPIGTLNGVKNNGYTNSSVIFTWTNNNCFATLDGYNYKSGDLIAEEGEHTIVLVDNANNKTTYYFSISYEPPVGMLNGVSNDGVTNSNVTFVFNEAGSSITLDSKQYTSNSLITSEGTHVIILTNKYGNKSTYTFTIDKNAPTGELHGVVNNGYTNSNVKFTWEETNCTCYLDDTLYSSGTIITSEGTHTLKLVDKANNTSLYTFEIILSHPEGTLIGVENGGITNSNVQFNFSGKGTTCYLDNKEYISGTVIRSEGDHEIRLVDKVGNYSIYTFRIDKSIPQLILIGVENDGSTNKDVTITWEDSSYKAYLENIELENGHVFNEDGSYTIKLVNSLGTEAYYSFLIKKLSPTGELHGVVNNGYTNSIVSFDWSEKMCTCTLNGKEYIKGSTIKLEGTYEIILSDIYGNSSIYNFTISKQVPYGELIGVKNGGYTNSCVKFTWEGDYTVTLDGVTYYKNSNITSEGTHVILVSDKASNTSSYTFSISKEVPNGTLVGVENNGVTNNNVTFSWDDDSNAILDGNAYEKGTEISSEGTHVIILTNKYGNKSTYTFNIDKTLPVINIIGLSNKNITNSRVKINWNEDDNLIVYLNGEIYEMNSIISKEGIYDVVVKNSLGTENYYSFTIDKTAPEGILIGVENNGITNSSVSFNWEESTASVYINDDPIKSATTLTKDGIYVIIIIDEAGNSTIYSFEIKTKCDEPIFNIANNSSTNSNVIITWKEEATLYVNNTEINKDNLFDEKNNSYSYTITENGNYSVYIKDIAGNTSNIHEFEIDKIAPTGELHGVENNGITNGNVSFIWNERYVSCYHDNKEYISGTTISSEGDHEIRLVDKVGNYSIYTFRIDKSIPFGIIEGVENGKTTNKNVSFSWTEDNCTATLNGSPYTSGDIISNEGKYEIQLFNYLGTPSEKYTFTIDKTAPKIIINDEKAVDKYNKNIKISTNEVSCWAELDGNKYELGSLIIKEGKHIIVIYDQAGNSNSLNFEICKSFNNSEIELTISINGEDTIIALDDISKKYNSPMNFKFNSNIKASLDDNVYISGATIKELGTHTLKFTDEYGNNKTLTFTIEAPETNINKYLINNVATIIISIVFATIIISIIMYFIRSRIRNPYKVKRK